MPDPAPPVAPCRTSIETTLGRMRLATAATEFVARSGRAVGSADAPMVTDVTSPPLESSRPIRPPIAPPRTAQISAIIDAIVQETPVTGCLGRGAGGDHHCGGCGAPKGG